MWLIISRERALDFNINMIKSTSTDASDPEDAKADPNVQLTNPQLASPTLSLKNLISFQLPREKDQPKQEMAKDKRPLPPLKEVKDLT